MKTPAARAGLALCESARHTEGQRRQSTRDRGREVVRRLRRESTSSQQTPDATARAGPKPKRRVIIYQTDTFPELKQRGGRVTLLSPLTPRCLSFSSPAVLQIHPGRHGELCSSVARLRRR